MTSSSTIAKLFLLFLVLAHAASSAPLPTKSTFVRPLSFIERVISNLFQDNQKSMCDNEDWTCHNRAALAFINEVRATLHLPEFRSGTVSMLSKAQNHSTHMAFSKYLYPYEGIDVGCNTTVTNAIVVETHLAYKDELHPDVATLCMKRFLSTPEYYRINLSKNPTETTLGVGIGSNGAVFCTQLFGKNSEYQEYGICVPSATDSIPMPTMDIEETPIPMPSDKHVASNGYVFKHIHADIRFGEDIIVQMELFCEGGKCFYCSADGSRCISETQSIVADQHV